MNKEYKAIKTPATINAELAKFAIEFFGLDELTNLIANTYRVRGNLNLVASEDEDHFNVYAQASNALKISSRSRKDLRHIDLDAIVLDEIKARKALEANDFYRRLDRIKSISTISLLLKKGVIEMPEVLMSTTITKNDFLIHGIQSMTKKRMPATESYSLATAC